MCRHALEKLHKLLTTPSGFRYKHMAFENGWRRRPAALALASVEEATAFVAGKFSQKVIKVADWLFYSASLVTVVVLALC